jgi:hypothetical protein
MYKEPFGGHSVLLAFLPIDAIEPTPFQRDLSDAHHKRLYQQLLKFRQQTRKDVSLFVPKTEQSKNSSCLPELLDNLLARRRRKDFPRLPSTQVPGSINE